MLQTHARLLEANGWEVECESPLEIFHAESCSQATGMAARIVLEYLLKEEEDYNTHGHTIDKHSSCKYCKSPLRINILRPDRCSNKNCKNYFKRNEE